MNWIKLLRDKSGRLNEFTKFVLISGGSGALALATLYSGVERAEQQRHDIRSLSSLQEGRPYAGLDFTADGQLTSINVGLGAGMANERERRAIERRRSGGNNFGLDGINNLNEGNIGRAAEFYDSEGLAMGDDKGTESPVRFASTASSANFHGGSGSGSAQGDATGGRAGAKGAEGEEEGEEEQGDSTNPYKGGKRSMGGGMDGSGSGNTLGSASMATASGTDYSGTYNPAGGNSPVTAVKSNDSLLLSGAMPAGTSALGLNDNRKSGSSSKYSGGRGGKGENSKEKTQLAQMTKQSALDANDKNGAVNKGGRTFLLGAAAIGGLAALTNAIFNGPSTKDLNSNDSALGTIPPGIVGVDYLEARSKWIEERDKKIDEAKNKFKWWMLAAAAWVIAGSFLLSALKDSPYGEFYPLAAALFLLGLGGLLYGALADAIKLLVEKPPYNIKVDNTSLWIMCGLGAGVFGAGVYTVIRPEKVSGFVRTMVKNLIEKPLDFVISVGGNLIGKLWNKATK